MIPSECTMSTQTSDDDPIPLQTVGGLTINVTIGVREAAALGFRGSLQAGAARPGHHGQPLMDAAVDPDEGRA